MEQQKIIFDTSEWLSLEASKINTFDFGPINELGYVYIISLIDNGVVKPLYIGMSINLRARLAGHKIVSFLKERKAISRLTVLYCSFDDIRKRELYLINTYNPPFNLQGKRLSQYKMIDFWCDIGLPMPRKTYGQIKETYKAGRKKMSVSEKKVQIQFTVKQKNKAKVKKAITPIIRELDV